jgi:hypothetical protein
MFSREMCVSFQHQFEQEINCYVPAAWKYPIIIPLKRLKQKSSPSCGPATRGIYMNEYRASLNETANTELEAASCQTSQLESRQSHYYFWRDERQRDLDSVGPPIPTNRKFYPSPLSGWPPVTTQHEADGLSKFLQLEQHQYPILQTYSHYSLADTPHAQEAFSQVNIPPSASNLIKNKKDCWVSGAFDGNAISTSCTAHTHTYRHACINSVTPCENFVPIRNCAVQTLTEIG